MSANIDNLKKIQIELDAINEKLENQTAIYESIEGASGKVRRAQREQLEEQERILDAVQTTDAAELEILGKLKDQLKAQKKLNDIISTQYQLKGRIVGLLKKEKKDTMDFLLTSAAVYNYAEKIAVQYKDIQKNVGLSSKQATALSYSFRAALPNVLTMGAEMEDIASLYNTFMEQSGRFRFMDDRDVEIMIGISEATNMLPSSVAEMAESFDLMGMSTETMNESLVDIMDSSNKMGLNSTKVIKTLQTNMKLMQNYSFVGGIRGMTEMAKQAVRMRIDVSDVLQMADKFYQPEAALEAAANLQMLGGDIAKAFGDPFETMYLARNKPEELAKRLQEMTENMLQFNEESGQYELPAEGRMQLKAAAEQLGIMPEKMIELARQSSKIKDIKMNISGNAFDDDVREGIAGMAKMKDGNWVVDFKGQEIGLDDTGGLATAIADGMLDTTETREEKKMDYFKNIAINTQTMSEQIKNANEATRATVVQTVDYYAATEHYFGDLVTEFNVAMQEQASVIVKKLEVTSKFMEKAKPLTLEDIKDLDFIDISDIFGEKVIKSESISTDNIIISGPSDVNVDDLTAMSAPGAGVSTMNHVGSVAMTLTVIDNGNTLGANISNSQLETAIIKGGQGVVWNGGKQSGSEAVDTIG